MADSNPSTTSLIYEPLDVEGYEIQMVILLLRPQDSLVRCSLEKTSLINPIRYAELSYCWGNPDETTKDFR
jgi:hypothetical protein